jgi:C-5 cytosine-specific DNA methylase
MKTVELFSGTKSFSKVASSLGHETFTFDNNPLLNPDKCLDIFDTKVPRGLDLLWASPPCTTFSVASISHYWKDGKPKNEKAIQGIAILAKTIEIITQSKPTWWFIENPRGMMRKVIGGIFEEYGITEYHHYTITYCQYGHKIMKPTDIWTNASWFKPRPMCKNGAPCHIASPRGSKTGLQGVYDMKWDKARGRGVARSVVPPHLFLEIFDQYEKKED